MTEEEKLKEQYLYSFEDISDIYITNLEYYMKNDFSDYPINPAIPENEIKWENNEYPLHSVISELELKKNQKTYFFREDVYRKKDGKCLSYVVCPTNALYSKKFSILGII